MLFNCLHCGKTISTKAEKCPYCTVSIISIVEELGLISKKKDNKILGTQKIFKGTIAALISKNPN